MNIDDLISGKERAPTQTAQYFVDQINELRAQAGEYQDRINKLNQQITSARTEAVMIEGAFKKAVADLRHWVEKSEEDTKLIKTIGGAK